MQAITSRNNPQQPLSVDLVKVCIEVGLRISGYIVTASSGSLVEVASEPTNCPHRRFRIDNRSLGHLE